MLSFKKLTIDDIAIIRPYFQFTLSRACDNTIGGVFMWRDFFNTEYCFFKSTLVFKVIYVNGLVAFPIPLGPAVEECLREIESYCIKRSIPFVLCTATQEDVALYKKIYPSLSLTFNKDWSDYVYAKDDLVTLAGRKYSGQRNHINYFMKNYTNYDFEEITSQNLPEIKHFYVTATAVLDKNTRIFHEEKDKTLEVLDNFDKYCLIGGLIRVNNDIIAFAIGEKVKDTLFVHIERADYSYRGSHQMMVNLFAKHFASDEISFINREEDVGDEGLRAAKNAYHPIMKIKKYTVEVNL